MVGAWLRACPAWAEKMIGVEAVAGRAPSTRSMASTRTPPNPRRGSAATAAARRSTGTCNSISESLVHSRLVATLVPSGQAGSERGTQSDHVASNEPLEPPW